jgi:hypothetical protein
MAKDLNSDHDISVTQDCCDAFNDQARVIGFDPKAYAHHLAQYDLPEDQQLMVMRALWDILVCFADAGFKIDPVSLAEEPESPALTSSEEQTTNQTERQEHSP